jgi:hypothetical protein
MVTSQNSGTNVHEIAAGIFRINTPIVFPDESGAFSFNQYLIVDDEPLVFHSGPRRIFPLVSEADAKFVPREKLRYIASSHFEALSQCGGMRESAPRSDLRRGDRRFHRRPNAYALGHPGL